MNVVLNNILSKSESLMIPCSKYIWPHSLHKPVIFSNLWSNPEHVPSLFACTCRNKVLPPPKGAFGTSLPHINNLVHCKFCGLRVVVVHKCITKIIINHYPMHLIYPISTVSSPKWNDKQLAMLMDITIRTP